MLTILRTVSDLLALGVMLSFRGSVLSVEVDFYKAHRLVQAGEQTFACVGRPIELKWKYRYPDIVDTEWMFKRPDSWDLTYLASWTLERGFTVRPDSVVDPRRFTNNGCCGLIINPVQIEDDGLYIISVKTNDTVKPMKTGNTTLYIITDCPNVAGSQLSISCDAADSSRKTTDFTFRDIVDLTVSMPQYEVVQRRYFYQEQQHKIVRQPIRQRCYYSKDCDVVHWTLSKKSLSLAFYSKIPYLNLTAFARLYHRRVVLAELNVTIRIVDPESQEGKSVTVCKNREPISDASIRMNPTTWDAVLLASLLTFALSSFLQQIVLLP